MHVSKNLYVQVLLGIGLGVILGLVVPGPAAAMKPLGDGFIKLVRMLIAPVIFTTVVLGIGRVGALKDVGRIGFKGVQWSFPPPLEPVALLASGSGS